MAYQLWALDSGAGQAVVVENDSKWLLLSLERDWRPVELRDSFDAFRWSVQGRAVTQVGDLTERQFGSLDDIISAISGRCREVIGGPAVVPTSRALSLCPDSIVRARALRPWSLSEGLTSLFWHCLLRGVEEFQEGRLRHGALSNLGLDYRDYVSLSLASIALWRLDRGTRLIRRVRDGDREQWMLSQAAEEAEEMVRAHRAFADLLRQQQRRGSGDGSLLHPWTSLREGMARVARTHCEALTGAAMHADEREWDEFLADRGAASERLRRLYTGVEQDMGFDGRDIAFRLLGGMSEDEIVIEEGLRLPDVLSVRDSLNRLLSNKRP